MTEDQGTLFDKLDKQLVIPGFPRHKKKVEVRKETEAEKLEAYAHKYRPQIEISNKIKDTYSSDISNEIIKTYIDNETSYQIQNIGHITRLITAASQFVNKEKKDLKLFDLILMYKSIEKGIGSEMIKEYDNTTNDHKIISKMYRELSKWNQCNNIKSFGSGPYPILSSYIRNIVAKEHLK